MNWQGSELLKWMVVSPKLQLLLSALLSLPLFICFLARLGFVSPSKKLKMLTDRFIEKLMSSIPGSEFGLEVVSPTHSVDIPIVLIENKKSLYYS